MIKLEELIVAGKHMRIEEVLHIESVIKFLGEPEIFTPAYKSYPAMLVYGDLEFRFRNNDLEIITITFVQNSTQVPAPINPGELQLPAGRSFGSVKTLLDQKQVSWEKDEIMSDPDQDVYITKHHVHLAFHKGILAKMGVVYR